jgi:hypothetical protein
MYVLATQKSTRKRMMAHKKQKVIVRGADGTEKELTLAMVSGSTAYVCGPGRAADDQEWWVGFPLKDVRFASGEPVAAK